jgi:DNA polymerase
MAEEGYRIMAGDFVSVEAVVLACLAGEQWKIDAFRAGEKIYERMADKIYGYPTGTVTKATHPAERFDGKTGELAFGYQGALGAWRNFDRTDRHTDERVIEICRAWSDIGFAPVDDWLAMILPNGKHIWYYQPLLSKRMPRWHDPATEEACADGTCKCEMEHVLSYMSMKNGQWTRIYTYGGKLAENATQATSREILMPAARRLERHGYTPVLTVYDEVVCEVPEGLGSLKEFEEIMIAQPEGWYASWPLSVDWWEGYRYKK